MNLILYNIGLMTMQEGGAPKIDTETLSRIERTEKQHSLREQFGTFLNYFYDGIDLSPRALEVFAGTDNVKAELKRRGLERGLEIISRNNLVADYLKSDASKEIKERERIQKGDCTLGFNKCIDGRLPDGHMFAILAGLTETMAGVLPTYRSRLDGRVRLGTKTLEQSIVRTAQQSPAHLQISIAHEHCGAMKKWEVERKGTVDEFESDDLIAENLSLFGKGIEAITRTYNNAAFANGKEPLDKVCVKAVYDVATMGIVVGYKEGQQLSSTELADQLCEQFEDVHAKFADNFMDLDILPEKERAVVDLIDRLYVNETFNNAIDSALSTIPEISGLNPMQQQAFRFFIAKLTAFQILTGVHKNEEESHVKHPFIQHAEEYMAISIDDGLNASVGQYDPKVQVFGAVVSGRKEAVEHILTEEFLMVANEKVKHPHILFLSNAIDEEAVGSDTSDKLKQAIANVARNFRDIVEDPKIAEKIKSGEIIVIPVIIGNRSREIIEIPNVAL